MKSKKGIILALIIVIAIIIVFILVREADDITAIEQNRTAVVNQINIIASFALDHYNEEINDEKRESFITIELPEEYAVTDFGTFEFSDISDHEITILGISAEHYGTVEATVDSTGEIHSWSYSGYFDTIPGKYGIRP